MTGLVRKATLLTACGLLAATAAMAGVPYAGTSTKSATFIRLVGAKNNVIDPSGVFTVTVRDVGSNIVPNVQVVLDFSSCTDTHAADATHQVGGTWTCATCSNPVTVDGTLKTVRATANASGVAVFDIAGAVTAGRPLITGSCAKLSAGGQFLANVEVTAVDQDGLGGVALADLSLWAIDFYAATNPSRSDYDGLGGVALADLSAWAVDFYSTNSAASSPAYAW